MRCSGCEGAVSPYNRTYIKEIKRGSLYVCSSPGADPLPGVTLQGQHVPALWEGDLLAQGLSPSSPVIELAWVQSWAHAECRLAVRKRAGMGWLALGSCPCPQSPIRAGMHGLQCVQELTSSRHATQSGPSPPEPHEPELGLWVADTCSGMFGEQRGRGRDAAGSGWEVKWEKGGRDSAGHLAASSETCSYSGWMVTESLVAFSGP